MTWALVTGGLAAFLWFANIAAWRDWWGHVGEREYHVHRADGTTGVRKPATLGTCLMGFVLAWIATFAFLAVLS